MASGVKGWTHSKILFVKLIITFLFSISTGRDQQQIPCPSSMQNVSGNSMATPQINTTKLIFMAFLTGLLSLFGCETKKNQSSKRTVIKKSFNANYPKDHKLSGQERKEYSNLFLKQRGVPTLEHLPLVDDYTVARFRDPIKIARRSVILYGLIFVANNEKTSEEIIVYFKKYGLWEDVSPEERGYVEKKNKTDEDNNPVTWRLENLNVLLWSLGHFDRLKFPTTLCDFGNYNDLPDLDVDPKPWIIKSRLRNTEDILNETDLIYRLHWATEDARINNNKMPVGLNQDVIMERHFALNWLTMYADDWDDITTDT